MSFSCLRSVDLNVSSVDVLYDDSSAEGHLYSGSGAPPLCSSISPPSPSSCVVCFSQFVHAVCSELLRNATLKMEGDGKPIDLMKSARCPTLLGDDTNHWSGNHADTSAWKVWLTILLLLLLLFLFIMTVLLVAFCKRRKCQTTPKNLERVTSAVDSSEAAV